MSRMPNMSFGLLQANYLQRHLVPTTALYESIGHREKLEIPGWENTCAVRVSLALVRSGIAISPGLLTIKAGRNKGARIESRQKHLSDFLVRRWGGAREVHQRDYRRASRRSAARPDQLLSALGPNG